MASIDSTATCKKCGCSFPRPNNKGPAPKTCGSCKREANRKRNRKKNRSWTHCAVCQEPLERPDSRGTAVKYCSKACRAEARKRKKAEYPECAINGCERTARAGSAGSLCEMHYYRKYLTGDAGEADPRLGGHDHCHYCGEPTDGRMFCDSRCNTRAQRGVPLEAKCSWCDSLFRPFNGTVTCSDECAEALRAHRTSVRRGDERSQKIAFTEVFERDQYICQGCGVKCLPELRGTHGKRAPEVDHIIPIAKGGTHTWGNVQTLCVPCNRSKGASLPEWFDERQPMLAL